MSALQKEAPFTNMSCGVELLMGNHSSANGQSTRRSIATGAWVIAAILVVAVATGSLLPRPAAAANAPDISGTWVAYQNGPFGEMELIGRFKTDAGGHIGGFLTVFNDSPIRDGRVVGDQVELTVEMD